MKNYKLHKTLGISSIVVLLAHGFLLNLFSLADFSFLWFGQNEDAAKVGLNKVEITLDKPGIRIQTKIKNAFNPELVEALNTGIPIAIFFKIELSKTRWYWFDADIIDVKVMHSISFDTLNKQYKFTSNDGKAVSTRVTEKMVECEAWMATLDHVLELSEDVTRRKGRFIVKVVAEAQCSAPGIFRTDWVSSKEFSFETK
jgi:hypothetical protein